ncbi:MAG: hypothetical protein ACJ731_06130 [Vicinamibacterales bacterium]
MDRLRDGSLPPALVAAVGGHAATCESCGRAVREVFPVHRMARDLRTQFDAGHEAEHLSDDELMACADGRSRNDAHLQECDVCRAEVDELLRFKSQLRPRRQWLPYAIAASIAAIALTVSLFNRAPDTPTTPPRVATSSNVVRPSPAPLVVATGYGRPQWDAWVADVKARRAFPLPAIIAELRPRESQLRGGAEEDDLQLSPDHEVVASTRPQFRWDDRQGATYDVILRDGDEIVESGPLTDPRWRPLHDLSRGHEYQWQVEMTIGGVHSIYPKTPAPPARFRVLEQSALDEIEEARKRYPEDALLQAVILARHGLRDEALAAVDRLERSDTALAASLRDSLRHWPMDETR